MHWQTLSFGELDTHSLYALLRLRQQVFVVEQACAYLDIDNLDQAARHMLCRREGELVAYLRCLAPGLVYPQSALGRIVVSPSMRGRNLGMELVRRGIDYNQLHWPEQDILISAQAHLQEFYAASGFVAEGEEYLEDDIPHRRMRYTTPASP